MPIKQKDKSQDMLDYEALCDIWKEANAVDTVIGRPDVLMQKIARLRDDFGSRKPTSRKDWEAGYERCRQDMLADAYHADNFAPASKEASKPMPLDEWVRTRNAEETIRDSIERFGIPSKEASKAVPVADVSALEWAERCGAGIGRLEETGKVVVVQFDADAWQRMAALLDASQPEPTSKGVDDYPTPTIGEVLDWAASIITAEDPRTSDWLYDDKDDLAKAIRKGPEWWRTMMLGTTAKTGDALLALSHMMDDEAQGITESRVYEFATQIRVLLGLDGADAAIEASQQRAMSDRQIAEIRWDIDFSLFLNREGGDELGHKLTKFARAIQAAVVKGGE